MTLHNAPPQTPVSYPAASSRRCLLCGHQEHTVVFHESGIDILRCNACRHVFSSYAAHPHYDGFWGNDVLAEKQPYWGTARAAMYGDFLKGFLHGRTGRLLDMGCGLGFFLQRVSQCPGWEVAGCEISATAVTYARDILGQRNIVCDQPETVDFSEAEFDIITMWDVIDHIPFPDPLLRRCWTLLKTGGICFIRTPNILTQLPRARLKRLTAFSQPNVQCIQPRDHLHHYSPTSIRKLLERNMFADIQFTHLQPVLSDKSRVFRGIKRVGFEIVRALALISRGRLNYDSLFVVARKTGDGPPEPRRTNDSFAGLTKGARSNDG